MNKAYLIVVPAFALSALAARAQEPSGLEVRANAPVETPRPAPPPISPLYAVLPVIPDGKPEEEETGLAPTARSRGKVVYFPTSCGHKLR